MEDEDSCRICRSGPEPDAPLYYPCKCTGSIRYCHQDCLVQWLQHSRKKYCELCNQPFIFHKKYRKDMPSDGQLPSYLYARRLAIRTAQTSQLAARAILVGFVWLALLPYININVWRFMFWSIDVATWMGVPGSVPPFDMEAPPANKSISTNVTANSIAASGRTRNNSAFSAGSLAHKPLSIANIRLTLRSLAEKLTHDVFQGQVLSCVIVVFFVGVFLLREWILQNMPQNFDLPPNGDGAQQPQPRGVNDMPPQAIEGLQRQIRDDFELRRERLERMLAEHPELDARRQPQPVGLQQRRELLADLIDEYPELGAQQQQQQLEEEAPQDELDLDPEAQREQARVARIRRLREGPPAIVQERRPPLPPDTAEQEDQEQGADAEGSTVAIGFDQPQQSNGSAADTHAYATRSLQDALGWSEAEIDVKPQDPIQQPSRAGSSSSTADQMGEEHASEAQAESSRRQSRMEEAKSAPADSRPADLDTATPQDAAAANRQPTEDRPAPETHNPTSNETAVPQDDDDDDDDGAWEDESDAEDRVAQVHLDPADEAALRAAAAAAFPPPIAHPVADDEIDIVAAADADDPENEIGLAEEMDGILEAVGMRGPLFGIVQNLFLMIFLCGFVMLAFVMMPYIVGRALGSGPGLIKLLALPVNVLRYLTDPVFDALIALGVKMVGVQSSSSNVGEVVKSSTSVGGWMQQYLPKMLTQAASSKDAVASPVAAKTSAVAATLVRILPTSVTASSQWKAVSDAFDVALATGLRGSLERIADYTTAFFVRLDAHRNGTSTTDRVFCVAFGHAYWLLVLFLHQHFSKPDLQRALADQSALKLFMDQHVLILKALSFIFIELIVFPLGCGLLFDICTMPLLPDASVASWPDKVRAAPLSFAFLRWMGGTIYMFVFAQYVSATRKVLRPGVLCWIRDPNDPSFHPIREILDKKSWTQLRKIGASAVMYAAILVASVGVNTYWMRYVMGWSGVLPLKWRPMDPWTEVPVDLLVVHFVVPWATQRVDPERVAEVALKAWWKAAARGMRLSSYLIGGEFSEERRRPEGNGVVAAWRAVVSGKVADGGVQDGGLCRVPADDKAVTSGPLIIPLNSDGSPATERSAEAITKQGLDAEKHKPKPTYTNIYLPSNYTARITTVLTLLWLSHCVLFIAVVSVPLVAGRAVAGDVHDFYSYSLGLTLILLTARLGVGLRKMWMRRIKRARWARTTPAVYMGVRVIVEIKRVCKALFLLVGVAGLLPLTVGLVAEQYLLTPLRFASTRVPVWHVGQIWALGIIQARLLLFGVRFVGVPSTGWFAGFMASVDAVVRAGLYPRPKVKLAWKRIVLPITLLGALMLGAPIAVAYTLVSRGWVHADSREAEQLLLRKVYGVLQSVMLVSAVRAGVRKRMESWTELLKDEVFLESTELKNFQEAKKDGDAYGDEGVLPDVMFH